MLKFTLKQLIIFINVANHLSISKAARSLHLSQPAVSQQIRKIEAQIGKQLFEQIGKQIYMTEEGKHLLVYAKKVIEQAEIFELASHSKKPHVSGKLSLSINTPLQSIFFNTLSKFVNQYPLIGIELLDGVHNIQLQHLKENRIDFCLMVNPVKKLRISCEFLADVPMTFIVSQKHRLADKKNVDIESLAKEKFIICEEDTANYMATRELFKKMHMKSSRLIHIHDQNAIKHAVIANLGISVLPRFMLEFEIQHNMLVPIVIKHFTLPKTGIYWVQHEDKMLNSIAQQFKKFILNEFKNQKSIA